MPVKSLHSSVRTWPDVRTVDRAVRQWVWDETRAEELLARRLGEVTGGARSPYDVAEEILDQVRAEAGRGMPQ